ncbi:MAG: hypothetical protein GF309_01275 [Candidatus Lokiarchaeota archaeon]|nr:hypothetical protein [Candidatus Lokiarchaeota archaeon]
MTYVFRKNHKERRKMPRKKNNTKRNALIVLVLIAVGGVIAWHDGLFGITAIRDINQGELDTGTNVRIKGELTAIVGNLMTVSDGDGHTVAFSWSGDKPALGSIVVVSGEVSSFISLSDVSSVWAVWIFK